MGLGGSMVLAQEAAHLFATALPNFYAVEDSHFQAIRCAMLTERDVVVYFSYSGSTLGHRPGVDEGQGLGDGVHVGGIDLLAHIAQAVLRLDLARSRVRRVVRLPAPGREAHPAALQGEHVQGSVPSAPYAEYVRADAGRTPERAVRGPVCLTATYSPESTGNITSSPARRRRSRTICSSSGRSANIC